MGERLRATRSFADAGELAQDEDHARDKGGGFIKLVVYIVRNFVGREPTDVEEAYKRRHDGPRPLVSDERTPSLGGKFDSLPEATRPCSHGIVCWLPVARQKQRPIVDDAIGFQSIEAPVDVPEKDAVVDHHR